MMLAGTAVAKGNPNAMSDGAVGAMLARAALQGALFNVQNQSAGYPGRGLYNPIVCGSRSPGRPGADLGNDHPFPHQPIGYRHRSMQLFLEQLLNGIAMGSIYALVTLGLALVYGILRILHVAHAAVYTVGAYAGLFCYSYTGSLLLAFLGGMIFCSVLGVAIERLVYYPLLKYPPYVPLIGSIAIMLSIEEICRLVAGPLYSDVSSHPAVS